MPIVLDCDRMAEGDTLSNYVNGRGFAPGHLRLWFVDQQWLSRTSSGPSLRSGGPL
jgi:hypothetical protein